MTITPNEGEEAPQQKRDISKVRDAFVSGDEAAMVNIHQTTPGAKEEHGGPGAGAIKNIVFGGLDGLLTTFAVVTAAAGSASAMPTGVVLVFGFANLFADGFAMGFGEYTSSKAEADYQMGERRREEWELDKCPAGERQEMIDIYVGKGFTVEDATTIIDTFMKRPKDFVDLMMMEELGIMPEDGEDPHGALKGGVVMFVAFCMFGAVPLLAFVGTLTMNMAFIVSCILTACCLAILGGIKGMLSHKRWYASSAQMVLNGAIAAIVSYGISYVVSSLVPASRLQNTTPQL